MGQSHSQNASLFNMTHKIAVRLRLVFILLGIVAGVSGITAILQAKTILRAHSELTRFALPMLTIAQSTERNLSAMFLVLEHLDTYQTIDQLMDARIEIRNKTENVRQNLHALRRFDISSDAISDLEQRLNVAEASSLRVLEGQSALFGLKAEIRETLTQLSTLQDKSHRILDDFAFDFTNQMETLIRISKTSDEAPQLARFEQIDALFVASLNVNTIGFGLNEVVALTTNQAQANRPSQSNRARSQIDARLGDIINRLTHLPKTPARRELAEYISTLRDIVAKEVGIFARLKLQQTFQQEFEKNRATHLDLITEISNMSTALVSRTLLMVDSTSIQLNSAVYQMIWVIAVAFFAVLITIAIANHIVIDRQFNQRIQALNNSVTAIANGDLDHQISISGSDELGDMARALANFRDNAEDLQRSNVELEKFAYVAAHDLRSPLHAIHDLSTWAIEDEESVLSEESHEYLTLLQQRVARLKQLLNDLLSYARVGQVQPISETVKLSRIVKEHAQLTDPNDYYHIRYVGIEFEIQAQLTPLQQIVGNLLNNAVKHHDRSQGNILVDAKVEMDALILTISDDGPGIEGRYQRRVFELFQTLRPRDEVEGSGLGLAIVKKLVSRQKGRIEMTSDPSLQRGTSFEVVLPLPSTPFMTMLPSKAAAA